MAGIALVVQAKGNIKNMTNTTPSLEGRKMYVQHIAITSFNRHKPGALPIQACIHNGAYLLHVSDNRFRLR